MPAIAKRPNPPSGKPKRPSEVVEAAPFAFSFVVAQWGLVVLVLLLAAVFWWTRPIAPTRVTAEELDAAFAEIERIESPSSPTNRVAASSPHEDAVRMPAEFEPQSAIILGCNELARYHRPTMLQIIRALHGKVQLIGLVEDAEQEAGVLEGLAAIDLPPTAIRLLRVPAKGMWVRDYGPTFVLSAAGGIRLLDTRYRQMRPTDDAVPIVLTPFFQVPRVEVPLLMEGGNLLSNGQGLCITSSAMIVWNEEQGYGMQEIGEVLAAYFGFENWVYLQPPLGEPTGHIDMFCTLVAPNVAVVGQYDPKEEPENSRILDEGAAILASTQTQQGLMQVVRIPMPPRTDDCWRSYTNVIFANGTLLVPTYPDVCPELDAQALAIYRRLLPDWKVVPIDASTLITKRGALHCVTINVPSPTSGAAR